jgi:hypothetical protein
LRQRGHHEPREIETGPHIGDDLVVLKGLRAGERIVSSANFLVDSESQLHYLHEALQRRVDAGAVTSKADVEQAAIEGAVQRLRPKLMTVIAVLASLAPILWESGIGSDVMKPIAAPIVGGMITSTIHVLILVPVFFVLMKEGALRRGTLTSNESQTSSYPEIQKEHV